MFRKRKRIVPQLNTSSTADISFMLLILFLATTSMDTDKGLTRELPPVTPDDHQPTEIVEGMVLRLSLDGEGKLTCDDKPMAVGQLRSRIVDFVGKRGKQHVIQLQSDRKAQYDAYFKVQNEIVAAYRTLRDRRAEQLYGCRLDQCGHSEQQQIIDEIPQRVAEVYQTEKGGQQ